MNRRSFIKHGALFVPTIYFPSILRANSVPIQQQAAFFSAKPAAPSGGGGCTPAYAAPYGTGDRTATITLTTHSVVGTLFNVDPPTALLNGVNNSDSGKPDWSTRGLGSTEWILFDFGTGVTVTGIKYYQNATQDQGVWKGQGSNDGSSFTDIGSSFSLSTAATTTITALSGNTTSYRYLRLIGVSGVTSGSGLPRQFEFETCPHS